MRLDIVTLSVPVHYQPKILQLKINKKKRFIMYKFCANKSAVLNIVYILLIFNQFPSKYRKWLYYRTQTQFRICMYLHKKYVTTPLQEQSTMLMSYSKERKMCKGSWRVNDMRLCKQELIGKRAICISLRIYRVKMVKRKSTISMQLFS